LLIALNQNHPAKDALSRLAVELRRIYRGESTDAPDGLDKAVNLQETNHGSGSVTYLILPGRATPDAAIASYQHIRRFYPEVLDILCTGAARRAVEITIEIGTLASDDKLSYSHHDLLRIMPRILALFRGTITPL